MEIRCAEGKSNGNMGRAELVADFPAKEELTGEDLR